VDVELGAGCQLQSPSIEHLERVLVDRQVEQVLVQVRQLPVAGRHVGGFERCQAVLDLLGFLGRGEPRVP
jgi:hypothetical protein